MFNVLNTVRPCTSKQMCCHAAFHCVSIISVSFQDNNINGHESPWSPLTTIHSSFSKITIWQNLSGTDWIKIGVRLINQQRYCLLWIVKTVYNFKISITALHTLTGIAGFSGAFFICGKTRLRLVLGHFGAVACVQGTLRGCAYEC